MASSLGTARVLALVRITIGVLWLTNVNWKMPPTFGAGGGGLYGYTKHAVENPVVQPFSWVAEHVILPHFIPFAWSVLIIESLLGACFILGLATRFWGAVGIAMSAAIWMSVGQTPPEWPWAYYMMIALNAVIFATAPGRTFGLDSLGRPAWRRRKGLLSRMMLRLS